MANSKVYYSLLYTQRARRDINKLDPVTCKRLKLAIEKFQKTPLLSAKKLTSSKIGQYRWRAGNYRIIFEISKNTIIILRIGHRREIYK